MVDWVYKNGDYWVVRSVRDYAVYKAGNCIALARFAKTEDGLSLAILYCDTREGTVATTRGKESKEAVEKAKQIYAKL